MFLKIFAKLSSLLVDTATTNDKKKNKEFKKPRN
jgi:hypothetical protein